MKKAFTASKRGWIPLNSLFYNIKQGFTQILRNRGMSLASIFSIVAMLFILGIFFCILVNLNLFTEVVRQDYDQVEVFLEDEVTQEQAQQLMADIENYEGVSSVTYRTKEEALDIMKERWGESGYLLDSLGENPLPASILIGVENIDDASAVSEYAGSLDGVEDIQYYRETVEKLTSVTRGLQIGAIVVMAFLIVVCIVVVSNTIKLTVFARSREIRIMKYVGATNWFIRGPFMTEGVIIGVFAALVATVLMGLLYGNVINLIGNQVIAIVSAPLISAGYMIVNMLIIFLVLGASIGAWGSIISMRKFLDA